LRKKINAARIFPGKKMIGREKQAGFPHAGNVQGFSRALNRPALHARPAGEKGSFFQASVTGKSPAAGDAARHLSVGTRQFRTGINRGT
jgi:hypothetical protein